MEGGGAAQERVSRSLLAQHRSFNCLLSCFGSVSGEGSGQKEKCNLIVWLSDEEIG